MSGDVSIKNFTRRPSAPRATFTAIAKAVLPAWDISLVFVGSARAKALNEKLREKEYVPNVLSYVVGEKSGEIIICPSEAAKQAPAYNLSPITYHLFLFIHGLLHLKGWAHGVTMERCEQKLLATFVKGAARSSHETSHSNRNRHRHIPGEDGRRRRDSR
jgi:rRNA maturation RNase YbeY